MPDREPSIPLAMIQSDGTLYGTTVVTPDGHEYRLPLERVQLDVLDDTHRPWPMGEDHRYRHRVLQLAVPMRYITSRSE
jgi:hypothetical protein